MRTIIQSALERILRVGMRRRLWIRSLLVAILDRCIHLNSIVYYKYYDDSTVYGFMSMYLFYM